MFTGIAKLLVFVVVPIAWQQGIYLMTALQEILNQCYPYAVILLKRYPALVDAGIIDMLAANTRGWLSGMSESVFKFLLAGQVWLESNQQITNNIRSKVLELAI